MTFRNSKSDFVTAIAMTVFFLSLPISSESSINMQSNGVFGDLLTIISSFLSQRQQRVILNRQFSEWHEVSAGVPQGSVLGPLFFLIYSNDLPNSLQCDVKLFVDDTSLFTLVENEIVPAQRMNRDLGKILQ